MKTIKTFLVILFIASITISCNKDDDDSTTAPILAPLQDPLAGFLTATGFNQSTTDQINAGTYEFGYSFIPLVNGKMTALVAKIPDTHIGMRVTVWDKVAGTVLRTESIDIPTANTEVTKSITALDLVKDKEYFLTFNGDDWYDRRRTDNANAAYPITVGDIKITSYAYINGTTQAMPTALQLNYYAGDCSFKFQK